MSGTMFGVGNTPVTKYNSVRNRRELRLLPPCKLTGEPGSFMGADRRQEVPGSETKDFCYYSCHNRQHAFHAHISSLAPQILWGIAVLGPGSC